MSIRVSKPSFSIREKLSELERPIGLKGSELMRAETAQEARDFVSAGRKNLIINGAMEVAQRGTSVTGETSAGAYLTVDRFANHSSGATFNSSQETVTASGMAGLPIKFRKYHKFSATTGANNCGIWQTIEDVRTVQGEHTFSFYARGINPSGGKLELDSRQHFDGSAALDTLIGTFVLTDVWQRFTFTFTPPSLSGKTIGSNSYYRLFVRQPDADNSTNAWHIDITGVQLEVGKNATEFEHRSYGEELALCERYFQKYSQGPLMWASPRSPQGTYTDLTYGVFKYRAPMRTAPAVEIIGSNFAGVRYNGSGYSSSSIALSTNTGAGYTTMEYAGADSTVIRIQWGFNWTINDLVNVVVTSTDSAMTFSAEL